MRRSFAIIPVLILLLADTVPAASAQQPVINLIRAFPQLTFEDPVVLTHAGDDSGMLYVVEQDGIIRSFVNSDVTNETTVFLDIEDRVISGGERGLLGLAFHPQYMANGRFFVYYTASTNDGTVTRLSRFERAGGAGSEADSESEIILFEVRQTASNHNGGDLAFGPDDMLYVSIGDGGGVPADAQDRTNLLGTIVRIDVDGGDGEREYGIPDDNPFVGNGAGVREEIFAYGLRNPWRFSIDAESGVIWAGDVGQNDWEEIDRIVSGGNYGWPVREGFECYQATTCSAAFEMPAFAYENGVQGRSVTGGYVYRGTRAPELVGAYVFGDFVSGRVWRLDGESPEFIATEIDLLISPLISAFGEDENQELHVLDYGSGAVYRFESALAHSEESTPSPLSETRFEFAGPNPFASRTSLEVVLPRPSAVRVDVFDMLGRRVGPAVRELAAPGQRIEIRIDADAADMATGMYVARLTTEWGSKSVLMTHIR